MKWFFPLLTRYINKMVIIIYRNLFSRLVNGFLYGSDSCCPVVEEMHCGLQLAALRPCLKKCTYMQLGLLKKQNCQKQIKHAYIYIQNYLCCSVEMTLTAPFRIQVTCSDPCSLFGILAGCC